MTEIYINQVKIFTTPFDDYDTIVKKYCLQLKEDKKMIDNRFLPVFTGEEISYPIKKDSSFTFKCLLEIFDRFQEDRDKNSVSKYMNVYSHEIEHIFNISFTEFLLYDLFYNGVYSDVNILSELRSVNNLIFGSKYLIHSNIASIKKEIEDKHEEFKEDVTEWQKNFSQLTLFEPVQFSEIVDDEKTFQILLNKELNLFKVFENLKLSQQVPFAILRFNDKTFVNVYTKNKSTDFPPESWIDEMDNSVFSDVHKTQENCIVLKLLFNTNVLSEFSDIKIFNRYIEYTNRTNNAILDIEQEILFTVNKSIEKNDIQKTSIIRIKCEYFFDDINIDRFVFLDMITNDPVIRYFLKVDETDNKTANEKDKFHIFFQRKKSSFEQSYLLTNQDDEEYRLKIRITNMNSVNLVKQAQYIMMYIIGLYDSKYQSVIDKYQSYGVSLNYKKNLKKRTTRNLEIKRNQLGLVDPYMFQTGYAAKCSKSKQPFIIKGDTVEQKKENCEIASKLAGTPHCVFEFPEDSGNFYTCVDPDTFDPNEKKKEIYIGLRKFKVKNEKGELDSIFAPCCTGTYNHAKNQIEQYQKNEKKKKDGKKVTGYIYANNKPAELQRFGTVYHNFLQIFQLIGIETEKIGKNVQNSYVVQRYGVDDCTSSAIACLLYATKPEFALLSQEERMNEIIRERLSLENENLLIIAQETCHFEKSSESDFVIDLIRDYEKYDFDPSLFIRVLEFKYKVNILLTSNGEDKLGDVVIPAHSKVYLRPIYNKKNPYIFINMFFFENTQILKAQNRKFQCELYKDKASNSFFFNEDHLFVRSYKTIFSLKNKVLVVTPLDDNRFKLKQYMF